MAINLAVVVMVEAEGGVVYIPNEMILMQWSNVRALKTKHYSVYY